MSREYTQAAWEFNFSGKNRAVKKLVMLNLADRANSDGVCFPSVAKICEDTQLDRRTVMSVITGFIDDGLIEDTKERKGLTKQVRVLKILLLKPEKEIKTQRKTNTQAFYGTSSTITGTTVPEQSNVAVKQPQMSSKGMAKCFEEQGKNRDNVVRGGMPDVLKRQIKTKTEEHVVDPIQMNEEDREQIKLSDHLASESLNSISVFNRIPNVDILEKQRMMKEQVLTYKEDW